MDRADDLHPEARDLLETMAAADMPDLRDLSPPEAREFFAEWRGEPTDVPDLASVEDRTIPGYGGAGDPSEVPVRTYTPDGTGPFPTLVYFHGGGWVIGSLDTADGICRVLADEADCVVVSVDYRLAPEHPFPAGLEDAVAATEWAASDPGELDVDGRVAVGGDSAGGNLAAAVALHARDGGAGAGDGGGPDLAHQTLIYPVVDPGTDWPSYEENGEGYYLERGDIDYFGDHYWRSDLERANPYACPLTACSHADLPPATVVTCGFDPLRDEGVAYAEALADDGVPVDHLHYPSLIHGVAGMLGDPGVSAAREVLADAAAALRDGFGGAPGERA
ncbi:alpha/beta hydrolase [Halobaculum sp. EA56]|uniref:alpha/beta hydrolase n=1 Tax=Halobaculum sp. EA56 TaxID=3421648 RepID=UPI003EBC71B2